MSKIVADAMWRLSVLNEGWDAQTLPMMFAKFRKVMNTMDNRVQKLGVEVRKAREAKAKR
jgi:hypothetical protein